MKRIGERTTKWTGGFLCVLVVAAYAMITRASTPVGVTPTLIGRGTFERFKVKTSGPSVYHCHSRRGHFLRGGRPDLFTDSGQGR
jgi:hypothetical protein